MANYLLIVRNRANEKARTNKSNHVYQKGDIIEILQKGISPGNKASKLSFFSYAEIRGVNFNDIIFLKEANYSSLRDREGKNYLMLSKRRFALPDDLTDSLSKDWENPTLINLGAVILRDKKQWE